MEYFYTAAFERSLKGFDENQKQRIQKALQLGIAFFETSSLPSGLGLKPLQKGIWEIRAGLADRILFRKNKNGIEFLLAGSHDDIKRFLKRI